MQIYENTKLTKMPLFCGFVKNTSVPNYFGGGGERWMMSPADLKFLRRGPTMDRVFVGHFFVQKRMKMKLN